MSLRSLSVSFVALGALAGVAAGVAMRQDDSADGPATATQPADASAAQPLDYATAQGRVPFRMLVPSPTPAGFRLAGVRIATEDEEMTAFQLFAVDAAGPRAPELTVAQSTAPFPVPSAATPIGLPSPLPRSARLFRMPSASAPHIFAVWAEADSYLKVTVVNAPEEIALLSDVITSLTPLVP